MSRAVARLDPSVENAGTGADAGSDYVGGLAGYVNGSGILRSYSTGLVSGKFVAGLVVQLASAEADFATGAAWDVNGGIFMR